MEQIPGSLLVILRQSSSGRLSPAHPLHTLPTLGRMNPHSSSALLFLSAKASASLTDLSGDAVFAWGVLVSSIADGGYDVGDDNDFGGELPLGTLGGNLHLFLTSLL